MARYPTLDEYSKRGNYQDGIKRCDELLKRNPNDSQLLTVKLQLVCAAGQDGTPILDLLASTQPPLLDPWDIVPIEQAVVNSFANEYPPPLTAGASVAKLWDSALKATTNSSYKLDILDVRFSRAINDNRLSDAQQALIQLKALQPKNRSFYMAHVAVTQLLSTSRDDLQSRLALSLARKAVNDRFDDDKTLDCRVPGQVFALQSSVKDLEDITGRPFAQSQRVHDALRTSKPITRNTANTPATTDLSNSSSREWLASEVALLKGKFRLLIDQEASDGLLLQFVANATRLFHTGVITLGLTSSRCSADACFLAVSGLIRLYDRTEQLGYLLYGAFMANCLLKHSPNVHEARLILVYLYMRLGLGSLAISMFDSLNVKEIQHDTVGHTMLTHVSQAHPHPAKLSGRDTLDPYERTQKALGVYNRHDDKLAEVESTVLRHGQTGMLFDLHELRVKLRTSLVRRLLFLEHRRIARLTGKPVAKSVGNLGPKATANWIVTADNRDFQATFDYGFNVERALYGGGDDPSEGISNIIIRLLIDSIWSLADGRALLVVDIDVLLQECEKTLRTAESVVTSASGSRRAEYLAGCVALHLAKLLTKVAAKTSTDSDEFDVVVSEIKNLNVDSLVSVPETISEHLADHLIYLDVLRVVVVACRYIKDTADPTPDALQGLETIARQSISKLINHAQEQSIAVKAVEVKKDLTGLTDLSEGLGLFGDDTVAGFSEKVALSAREGWKGAASVTLVK